MNDAAAIEDLVILILASLVPALVFLSWIRTSERYRLATWGTVLRLFGYGAVVATFIALILEVVLVDVGNVASKAYPAPEFSVPQRQLHRRRILPGARDRAVRRGGPQRRPGSSRTRAQIGIISDGPVFGASVGLGFGFFETFLYGLGAFLVGGLVAGLTLILIRSFSSVLLHGSSTAMFGYGYAAAKLQGRSWASGGYYLLAVAMHASFNVFASLGSIALALGFSGTVGNYAAALGLLLAIIFAIGAIDHVATVVHQSAFPSAGGSTSRYRAPPINRPPPPGTSSGNR